MGRTRRDVEAEMEAVVADARACDLAEDELSYELDHERLNNLLVEYEYLLHHPQ